MGCICRMWRLPLLAGRLAVGASLRCAMLVAATGQGRSYKRARGHQPPCRLFLPPLVCCCPLGRLMRDDGGLANEYKPKSGPEFSLRCLTRAGACAHCALGKPRTPPSLPGGAGTIQRPVSYRNCGSQPSLQRRSRRGLGCRGADVRPARPISVSQQHPHRSACTYTPGCYRCSVRTFVYGLYRQQ
jgi:hypothetical protein